MLAGFLLALILVVATGIFMMGPMMGTGGMMGSGTQGGGGAWAWPLVAVLLVSAAIAVALPLRRAASRRAAVPPLPGGVSAPIPRPPATPESAAPPATRVIPSGAPVSELEALALRLLDRDERLLFIEVRENGGAALQKDMGKRDGFSRSKVTRTLDRLEAKGLIARERDGMTNRVRLLTRRGEPPST
jgi:uncharacterized membrane protein